VAGTCISGARSTAREKCWICWFNVASANQQF
jgi:hypothetical protein